MSNYDSMTEDQIQKFMESKNKCNNTNVDIANKWVDRGITYSVKDGKFLCIWNDTFENSDTKKKETAAHIIWQAAQDYKINPQVLIVLLQKEQGLITDDWPNSLQYRSATGYGCPDTAACDSKYYDFYNQVRNAAKLFRTVLDGGWTNYPLGNNYIQYNPDASCGGTTVKIENLATSALYRYTPYQPNQGALNAYTGTASCGAYGNRNFYIYFWDWFGDPRAEKKTETVEAEDNTKQGTAETTETKGETTEVKTEENAEEKPAVVKSTLETYVEKNQSSLGTLIATAPTCFDDSGKTVSTANAGTYNCGQEYEKTYLFYNLTVNSDKTKEYSNIANYDKNLYKNWLKNITTASKITKQVSSKILETKNGAILGSSATGYYFVKTSIYKKWTALGGENYSGLPIHAEEKNKSTGIEWQYFKNNTILGNDSKGWFESRGKIRDVWKKYNFEMGILGYPTGDIENNSGTGIYWQNYEKGVIVGDDKVGYHLSMGGSRKTWEALGFEWGSKLGRPTSDFNKNRQTGMEWQDYEFGKIVGNDQKGWFESRGKIREKWEKSGFEWGRYGWPTSNIVNGCQKYTGGTICE